jgi:hypothetical protein
MPGWALKGMHSPEGLELTRSGSHFRPRAGVKTVRKVTVGLGPGSAESKVHADVCSAVTIQPMAAAVGLKVDVAADIAAIDRLDAVGTALKVLRRTTGLRIALVARVTDASWTACAVLDEAGFGLKPGDELELSTTY